MLSKAVLELDLIQYVLCSATYCTVHYNLGFQGFFQEGSSSRCGLELFKSLSLALKKSLGIQNAYSCIFWRTYDDKKNLAAVAFLLLVFLPKIDVIY